MSDDAVFVDPTGRRGRRLRALWASWPVAMSLALTLTAVALLHVVDVIRIPFVARAVASGELVSADGNAERIQALNERVPTATPPDQPPLGPAIDPELTSIAVEAMDDPLDATGALTQAPPAEPALDDAPITTSTPAPAVPTAEPPPPVPAATPTAEPTPTPEATTTILPPPPLPTPTAVPSPTPATEPTPPVTPSPTSTPTPTPTITSAPTPTPTVAPTPTVSAEPTPPPEPVLISGEVTSAARRLRNVVRRGEPASSAGLTEAEALAVCSGESRSDPLVDAGCAELGY